MASASDPLKLIIRTTNHKYADFDLEILSVLTVYDLKQKIRSNHPAKPTPKDQRLIFSGKLLDDASILNQVFAKTASGSTFMIHLVLDSDKNATTQRPSQPTTVQANPVRNEQVPTSETTVIQPHSSAYEQYLAELNKYQQQLQQFVSNPNTIQPVGSYENQAYLQYCYTHYQMYQNLLAYQRTVSSSVPGAMRTASTQQATPDDAETSPQPAAQQQRAPGNNNNNNNELEQENDLLGILNMLVELFVLCSIIYFYSTFSRFLVVFVIFALLYLHCRGYFSFHRRRRVQVLPAAAAAPEQPAGNDGDQGGEDEVETEAAANEAQNQNDVERQRPPPTPPAQADENPITTSRLLLTAVSTFFSSLIPERPQRT